MKNRLINITLCLFLFLCIFSGCTKDNNNSNRKIDNTKNTQNGTSTTSTIQTNNHSEQVKWILENSDEEFISPSYENGSEIGIFHMLGTRIYVFAGEKDKYFADESNEKAMIAAVKYFIFAAEGEEELCKEMSSSNQLDISKISDVDIFEKRPLYIHPPIKKSNNTYSVKLEYILSSENMDIPADKRHHATIELSIQEKLISITNIIWDK